ncbi:hypothetical protein PIB30_062795 [Stylosanthes scabra]|uniref:Putative plant transposon protein domain-containing protein n=1 Tax=Stylosanthes scabra TaxID=79078 RepID=A0ABU6UK21_9FABA|nr:hypothetical protein [Stylosanthes scabra]
MASSSDASRKRRGKAVVIEEDTFDAHRFKTLFHEHFFNSNIASKPIIPDTRFDLEEDQYPQIRQQIELRGWKRLNKPKKRISQTIIREFYANARIDPNNEMASSSDASRKRRGKAVVIEEDTFDAHRFKTPFHEHFFNSNVASKPIIPDTRFDLEEDQYPQIRQQIELRPRFHTFVRGMLVNFSMNRIKTIMKVEGPLNSETSYRARMVEGNQDLDAVTRDLCVEGAVWSLGARNNPLYLKRSDLNPVARGWHEFIIHNIMPTTNQSEVTLNRAVLIHCIMSSQEVRVEKIIVDAMMNIINKLHTSKPPLAFPNIIARLCEEMEISFLASGPDMANMSKNQTEFYDSMLAQQTAYGLRLQEMETRQQEMWQFQQEVWQAQHQFQQDVRNYQEQQREQFQFFQKEQEKMQKELTNYKKNFSSHMGKLHAAHEEQKTKMGQTNQILINHALDSQAGNMYTHWALQQSNQNLVPMIPTKIPPAIRDNFKAGRPLFHGMLRPWLPEGSSNALGQQATLAVDVPRNPNANADDED